MAGRAAWLQVLVTVGVVDTHGDELASCVWVVVGDGRTCTAVNTHGVTREEGTATSLPAVVVSTLCAGATYAVGLTAGHG
jgi:hypothetical protein